MEDDAVTKRRIQETVLEILKKSDSNKLNMSEVLKQASEQLDLDLSQPHFKSFVFEAFLQKEKYDSKGNRIVCKLSCKRMVTVNKYRGKRLVSIRDYYRMHGKEHPSIKGISLTKDQWLILKKNFPAIEEAIKKVESGNKKDDCGEN